MKVTMIYPNVESEKAMSNYSLDLIEGLKKQGISVVKGEYIFHKPWSLFRVLPKLTQHDIIHIQHEYNILGWRGLPFFPLLLYLKLFYGGKTILTLHNVSSKKAKFKEDTKIKGILRKILYVTQNKLIKHFSDYTIVHCDYFREILAKEYGFNKQRMSSIPQAVKENIKTLSRKASRKELKLPGKNYLIIGTFVPEHGAADVVKQADRINGKVLIVTNDSPIHNRNRKRILDYIDYVKHLVKNPKIGKNVRLDLKEIPFDLWWKYFSASDLVLLPYKEELASGIFSDAIAMKVPMVGADIPYFREFARKYGIIEIAKERDFASTINRAMEPKNYKKIKKNMRDYLKEFGVSNIGKKYKPIYEKILNK